MAKLQGGPLDLQNYPPQRFRLESIATDPVFSVALAGKVWMDSSGRLKFINTANMGTLRSTLDAIMNGDIGAAAAIDPTKIAGTAVVTADARLSNARTPTGAAGGSLAGTFPNPTIAGGAITATEIAAGLKPSAGAAAATEALRALGTTATTAAAGNDSRLSDARTPVAHTHTVSQITDFLSSLNARSLSSFLAPTADVTFGGFKATNLGAPTNAQDAATKAYVDAAISGLSVRPSVRGKLTGAYGSTDPQTLELGQEPTATVLTGSPYSLNAGILNDGVTYAVGDRVLVDGALLNFNGGSNAGAKPQGGGIYVVTSLGSGDVVNQGNPWVLTRASDADTWNEMVAAFVFVEEGASNKDTGWVSTADRGGTLGTTAVLWAQFSAAGAVSAGAGLAKTGSVISVATGGIAEAMMADGSVDLASATVINALPVTKGGTGATTAAQARANLGITTGGGSGTYVTKYTNNATHAAGTTIAIPASTHGLGAGIYKDVVVRNASTGAEIDVENSVATNGDVTVGPFAESQPANTWAVAIFG